MQISAAWHALHAIAEMEWVHSSVTIASIAIKFIPNTPSYAVTRLLKYNPFSCYDNTVVMSFRFSNAPEIFIIHTSANFEKSKTQIFSNK